MEGQSHTTDQHLSVSSLSLQPALPLIIVYECQTGLYSASKFKTLALLVVVSPLADP